jgi:transcriptional regulator with XRE-family HTH domain
MNNKLINASENVNQNVVSCETAAAPTICRMETRQILRKLIDREGISEWRLSDQTGVSQSTINAILKGRSKEQKDSTLEPLAAYFGVSLKQLRGYDQIEGISEAARPRNEYPVLDKAEDVQRLLDGVDGVRECARAYVTSAHPKGKRCFVFTVSDDAMAPVLGKGAKVFVDPDFQYPDSPPMTGMKLALISVRGHLAIRMEADDLGAVVYKPLGAGFRTVGTHESTLVGYVVGIPEQDFTAASIDVDGLRQTKGV